MNKKTLVDLLLIYMDKNYPELKAKPLKSWNGIKWKQYSQYIDKTIETDIRCILGEQLQEFYWESDWQYVYIK